MNDFLNSSALHLDNTNSKQSVLELSHDVAYNFFLRSESYSSIDLPDYFSFDSLIKRISDEIGDKSISDFVDGTNKPSDCENVNYTIFNNKDGKYAWRPLQLINPVLYVSLVKIITEKNNWNLLVKRFKEFSLNSKIRCLSLPLYSTVDKKGKAAQIYQWWQEFEQRSIELALEFDCLLETDITNCYGSIYTHSIAWAVHGKHEAKKKENRNNKKLLGVQIDKHIQDMQHGQTNGIPQGSILMDFIAEIVLGYADCEISDKLKAANIEDFFILRYRDDYRIFTNNPQDGEQILKILTEVAISLGLKLNPSKTKPNQNVIRASIKEDKIAWYLRKQEENCLQKNLLIIHDHAINYPNSGSLTVALQEYYDRLDEVRIDQPKSLISIVVDIAFRNPRVYTICAAILSKLLSVIGYFDRENLLITILEKFKRIPNTEYLQIWLQRVSISDFQDLAYEAPLCKVVMGQEITIWNNEWIRSQSLKCLLQQEIIFDQGVLNTIRPIIHADEFNVFVY